MKVPTQQQLEHRCRHWQARLSLQDWRIAVRFARSNELNGDCGSCVPSKSKRHADIALLHPDDVASLEFTVPYAGWEGSLVHELLHLHMFDVLPEWDGRVLKARHRAAERMIDAVAMALIADTGEGGTR